MDGGTDGRMETPARPKTVAWSRGVREPLAMKHIIERGGAPDASRCLNKSLSVRSSALEARPVSGGQRCGLVTKEQPGVAADGQHLAPAPFEIGAADDPALALPAADDPPIAVMEHAAVSKGAAAVRDGVQGSPGIDANGTWRQADDPI